MTDKSSYAPLSEGYSHKCFGCSQVNPHGLKMKFYGNGKSVISPVTVPEYMCGWSRLVHGGILSVILDEIMSWSVLHVLKNMVLTKSMTIDFIKPVPITEDLTARGTPLERIGRNEALVEGIIFDAQENICARSRGNFVLLKPRVALRLGIVDEKGVKGIEKIING
jgi:uncharacterized protein (TIGR00369 family)